MKTSAKTLALIASAAWAVSCARGVRVVETTALPRPDWASRVALADALCDRAHFVALKEALVIYRQALAAPGWRDAVAEKYVRTAIALGLRAKALGIDAVTPPAGQTGRPDASGAEAEGADASTLTTVSALVAADPKLAAYGPLIGLLGRLPSKIKGTPGTDIRPGRSLDDYFDWIRANAGPLDARLEARAASDDLAACLRISLREAFAFKFEDGFDPAMYASAHPNSRLVAFQCAVTPKSDRAKLEALLDLDPGFAEAHYYLADLALAGGKLLTAERHDLAAWARIPESPSIVISLAKIAFQMEEFESCLEYDERALALVPTYRDALLGKAICLGYLGRNGEALGVLERMLELGTYYIGEAHYWTAWNMNELDRLEEARRGIDAARTMIVGQADVMTLAGIIAFRQGRLDDADKDLQESLRLEPEGCDAAFYLGKVYAAKKEWLASAVYFAGAAEGYWKRELGVEGKIKEIEKSEMAADRKTRLTRRKNAQRLSLQAVKATCQYNGAAGFFNAGQPEQALGLAELSAAHPAFAEKAADLVKRIRGRASERDGHST